MGQLLFGAYFASARVKGHISKNYNQNMIVA
jgi:hypothetical protein